MCSDVVVSKDILLFGGWSSASLAEDTTPVPWTYGSFRYGRNRTSRLKPRPADMRLRRRCASPHRLARLRCPLRCAHPLRVDSPPPSPSWAPTRQTKNLPICQSDGEAMGGFLLCTGGLIQYTVLSLWLGTGWSLPPLWLGANRRGPPAMVTRNLLPAGPVRVHRAGASACKRVESQCRRKSCGLQVCRGTREVGAWNRCANVLLTIPRLDPETSTRPSVRRVPWS
jgi:hypothetical protein